MKKVLELKELLRRERDENAQKLKTSQNKQTIEKLEKEL